MSMNDAKISRVATRALLFTLLVIACGVAPAQRLIVVTTSLSVTRDPTRVCMQSVDMRVGEPLPGFEVLPGAAPTGPLIAVDDGSGVVLSTAPAGMDVDERSGQRPCYTSGFRTAPFQRMSKIALTAGWRESAACALDDPAMILSFGGIKIDSTGQRPDNQDAKPGRIDLYRCAAGSLGDLPEKTWELPETPVAAVSVHRKRVAVLCRSALGAGMTLTVIDIESQGNVEVRREFNDDSLTAATPSALAVTRDGAYLLVLASGYALDPPSGEAASWLHVLDTTDFVEHCKPVMIPGASESKDQPLTPCDDAECWVVTRSPGTDLAYVSRIHVTPSETLTETQIPLTGVSSPVRLALEPEGNDLAVGVENRIEVWTEGRRGGPSETYEAPVGVVRWTPEGLFAAEAGCIHQVDPQSCTTLKRVQLQTGWVVDMTLIPSDHVPAPDPDADGLATDEEIRLGTSPASPDTDGDGIPDGSDPDPIVPSPRLRLPDAVEFHEQAIGQEVEGIKISPDYAEGYFWRLAYDRKQMPWLVIYPLSDKAPGVIYLGADPGRYTPGKNTEGKVTVDLVRTDTNKRAAGSPATFDVRVLSEERYGVRRILWIREQGSGDGSFRAETDPYRLRALGDMLAGPPYHFTHREAVAPTQEDLGSYGVVVLGVAAAAQGALTRQSLLRYVVDGGALLLLGGFMPQAEGNSDLGNWLAPLGIQLDTSARTDAVVSVSGNHPILRHVASLQFTNGCAVTADERSSVLIPAGPDDDVNVNTAALLARPYGRGRIAVLASPTPLETSAMANEANRLFAADLFQWLTEGGSDTQEQDMDSDGLPDSIEDKNGNGLVDPGETDYLDPDSDGDGLPDGVEDADFNGVVDEGETSPLNPDSDGDGIFDGADPTPLPPVEAPVVSQVTPAQAPAEGGTRALVSGRNFSPDAAVWFGNRQASQVRIMRSTDALVDIPPCATSSGGDVSVRVVNSSAGQEGALPKGFHYAPRSTIPIVLYTLRAVSTQKGMYEGSVSLRIEPPPGIMPDKILLLLRAEPAEGFEWQEPAAPVLPEGAHRFVVYRRTQAGDLHVVMLSTKPGSSEVRDIGPISWKYAMPAKAAGILGLSIQEPRVLAHNNQPLDVNATNVEIDLKSLKPQGAP